jgi:hypothetical protein
MVSLQTTMAMTVGLAPAPSMVPTVRAMPIGLCAHLGPQGMFW